jgi:serine protease Do
MSSLKVEPRAAPWSAALLSMAVLVAGCSRGAELAPGASAPAAAPAKAAAAAPSSDAAPLVKGLPDFTALVDRYGPAVVNVAVVEKRHNISSDEEEEGGPIPDPLQDFLRRFGQQPRGVQPPSRGEGSGFIVTPDGFILTNAHVVADASDVTVRLTDRREFTAKVVGVDRKTDVAVIKIQAKSLPTVRIGDPSKLRPGEWVVAIGSPFGFDNSVTAGIVSATSRALPDGAYTPFIQTDAAVNPGNSGGPLFNMAGEVVGINSQIYSRTGGFMGISFAIPIDVAMNVEDQLIHTGHVERGRIGVVIQDVNQALADSFGLDRPRGALVSQVEEGAPGAKAGLKPGDVILAVNGKTIERSSQLPSLIGALKPGSRADLEVWRDKSSHAMPIQIAELKEGRVNTSFGDTSPKTGSAKLGLSLRPLSAEERRAAGVDGGLLVEDVEGPALRAQLQPGDVIVGVNGNKVKSVEQFDDAVAKSGKSVALLVNRGGQTLFLPLHSG